MVVGENKRNTNIMDGIENTGDVRLHDHRLRLKQRFDIVRKLGQGTYGKVQLGINKKTGQEVAIKTIKKCKIESEADLVRIRREVQIMSSVRHPNIVHIYEVFENSEKMILVMEYCSGGELYDYLSQKKVLQEDEARRLFRQIATATYYCHIHKICHRDLKLENVLLDDTGSAKIADFGLSNVFKETSLLSTFCGSPLYASPEIVKGTPYIGPEVDCWSLGVLLYTLVYGAMPFDGSNFKRLVRQISNGDYYEPKSPSSASSLIRDMLTVDPLKRADIAYICDHAWVNEGHGVSCLEQAERLAAETPVRLDLLLSLAPPALSHSHSLVVLPQGELGQEESGTDLTNSTSMAVEPSNSAEKRILDLVAEGGEDAIKPSPTRTIVSAGDNKRKLELAVSSSGLQRKKERVTSGANLACALPEEVASADSSPPPPEPDTPSQSTLQPSATMTIAPSPTPAPAPAVAPAPVELTKDLTREIVKEPPMEEVKEKAPVKPRVAVKKKISPTKSLDEKSSSEKQDEKKEGFASSVSAAAEKLTSLSLSQPSSANQTPTKPKKFSIPGGSVGSFKEQFERRASLTTTPEVKRNVTKPVSKLAKGKSQSEERELTSKPIEGAVTLQQIGIEPSPIHTEELNRGGVKKTESEPSHSTTSSDPSLLLQDARRSLQNSMAKLVEEKQSEDSRRRAARDIISTAIRTGKPPVPYGRSSSAGVTCLSPPPAAPPVAPPAAPPAAASAGFVAAPRLFRTEAHHVVDDHRPRGVSVERIIPINVSPEEAKATPPPPPPASRPNQMPLRRLVSSESTGSTSEAGSSAGEPIKKSAREFIIPIAVEGKGYVTPRQGSLEPAPADKRRVTRHRRISSLVSGGESEEEDDTHMHRLRSSRAARAESVSSGEEDEEDEGFHLLTAENLFSTLLHRVRALTNRLNGEEGTGFPQHPHSLFNNLQSPFFNSPHLPRRHLLREGWGSRDLHADFDSMFNKSRQQMPRGKIEGNGSNTPGVLVSTGVASPKNAPSVWGRTAGSSKKSGDPSKAPRPNPERTDDVALDLSDLDLSAIQFSERELRALSGLTPALSRRLQQQLLAHLPPAAASTLRRTLSLSAPPDAAQPPPAPAPASAAFCTLPRLRRQHSASPAADPERPLLSKYLSPSLDEAYSSDGGNTAAAARPLRRHDQRLVADRPKKRISRFLRPDFFDTPPDESLYAKHKREKEQETQKILREIREKKNRSLEATPVMSPTEANDVKLSFKDDTGCYRKCLSPVSVLPGKDRSRSTTPFFPILDNIKETTLDTSPKSLSSKTNSLSGEGNKKSKFEDSLINKDSRLMRPKSYPVKTCSTFDESKQNVEEASSVKCSDSKESEITKESKLLRPKSYPTSSPSPEKVFVSRTMKKEESKSSSIKEEDKSSNRNDVEVSFSISLPRKKSIVISETEPLNKNYIKTETKENFNSSLALKKVIPNGETKCNTDSKQPKMDNGLVVKNGGSSVITKVSNEGGKSDKNENSKLKPAELDVEEKKATMKKKIIRKVSSKSKTDAGSSAEISEGKGPVEKKKITKKVKEKVNDDGSKTTATTKKKTMLQSIGQKFEKFASSKSSSCDKSSETNSVPTNPKKESRFFRGQREQSVPVKTDSPEGSTLIKRAATLTDVAALDTPDVTTPSKTTVSKVLGLFKKFDSKDKCNKPPVIKSLSLNEESVIDNKYLKNKGAADEFENDKPKRPTSLMLNGMGKKNIKEKSSSDNVSISVAGDDVQNTFSKKENECKESRNSLKLDFSRLPRVKKIVPTNPVIEPQIMSHFDDIKEGGNKKIEKSTSLGVSISNIDVTDTQSRSRSRSRSTISNSEVKSDHSNENKYYDRNHPIHLESFSHHPPRNHESNTPEKEDIVDRIRRKSFYTRFNEKKLRRKSSLVGPGATEYDPVARLHSQPSETKYDLSPSTPGTYDLSPGFSVASDLSPSTERYRSLLSELPVTTRSNVKYDNYGLNDKFETYRSLDRSDLRKYPGSRSYLDYDQPQSYGTHRYSRTKSLLDSSDGADSITDHSLGHLREPLKYNRTISMYSPGNYATYRPKRTLNSAIILKESEKEPSPENILDKIRNRKTISISVTRKPDFERDLLPRSTVTSKSEGNSAKCPEKVD